MNLQMGIEAQEKVASLIQNKIIKKYAKDYPEFYSLKVILESLDQNPYADVTDKEQELLDEIEEISKPHIKAVVVSDPRLVDVYNAFVDLYEGYHKKQERIHDLDKQLYDAERSFTDKVKDLAKNSDLVQAISKSQSLAVLYNNEVTLFNHYSKKQQLKKAIEGL